MRCGEIEKKLSEYIDKVLSEEEMKEIESHLSGCSGCRDIHDSMVEIAGIMAEMERVDPPAHFIESINNRLTRRPSFGGALRRMFSPVRIKLPLELAGVAAAVILIFYVSQFSQKEEPVDDRGSSAAIEAVTGAETRTGGSEKGSTQKEARREKNTAAQPADHDKEDTFEKIEGGQATVPDQIAQDKGKKSELKMAHTDDRSQVSGKDPLNEGIRSSEKDAGSASTEEESVEKVKSPTRSLSSGSRMVRQPRRFDVESWRKMIGSVEGKLIEVRPPDGVSSPDSAGAAVYLIARVPEKNYELLLVEIEKLREGKKISTVVTEAGGGFLTVRIKVDDISGNRVTEDVKNR
ncbi:MAG: zf-HC2 domain-containing protein [Candidatus Krumholzibacteriota bacterium]|nr:zf-HC2 domain-containing protein [Candidatus Krumholzibacteriota bacterium]